MRAALPIECVEANPGEPAADAGVAIPAASRRAIARKARALVMFVASLQVLIGTCRRIRWTVRRVLIGLR